MLDSGIKTYLCTVFQNQSLQDDKIVVFRLFWLYLV